MKKLMLLLAGLALMSTTKIQAQTVTDIDGNVYNIVTIGTQVWMKENLKVTHYRNGTLIPFDTSATSWASLTTGARCYYDNDSASYEPIYGALYNWTAAVNINNICPLGWHLPSDGDWNILAKYLDNTVDTTAYQFVGTDIGGKLKESGYSHWNSPNTGATNSSNFTALPGVNREASGWYAKTCTDGTIVGLYGCWWTSKDNSSGGYNYALMRYISWDNSKINRGNKLQGEGLSIRCVRDSLSNSINYNSVDNRFQIFPNPAIDMVTLEFSGKQQIKMQVYNMMGECVLESILTEIKNDINISNISKGMYVIKLTGNGWTAQKKIIKE